jgi:hypothetical protein
MAHLRLIFMGFLCLPELLYAGGIALRFGTPAVGSGGPNPLSIPPAGRDMGLSYVTDKGTEYNLAITGFSVAARNKTKWGGYSSLGAGFAFSANGGGIGPYGGFGIEVGCGGWIGCFSAEFTQALGISFGGLASPTALRIGVMKWF